MENISEQNKKEANEVAELYLKYCHYSTDRDLIPRAKAVQLRRDYSVECAIINRQSVLEKVTKIKFDLIDPINSSDSYIKINNEINNLTEQITYLKSKL